MDTISDEADPVTHSGHPTRQVRCTPSRIIKEFTELLMDSKLREYGQPDKLNLLVERQDFARAEGLCSIKYFYLNKLRQGSDSIVTNS